MPFQTLLEPLWALAILGPFWGLVAAKMGRLGDVLGSFWAVLGASWAAIGDSWGSLAGFLGLLDGQDRPRSRGIYFLDPSWSRLGLHFGRFWDVYWMIFQFL